MNPQSIRYIAALHQLQHIIFDLEAGNIDADIALRETAQVARDIPAIDREWRKAVKGER